VANSMRQWSTHSSSREARTREAKLAASVSAAVGAGRMRSAVREDLMMFLMRVKVVRRGGAMGGGGGGETARRRRLGPGPGRRLGYEVLELSVVRGLRKWSVRPIIVVGIEAGEYVGVDFGYCDTGNRYENLTNVD